MGTKAPIATASFSARQLGIRLLAVGLFALAGCSESIREYTKLGRWSQSPKEPIIFSGSPSRDAAAHGASLEVLTEHDWQILEKISPRPIWERLAEARALFMAKRSAASRPVESPPDVVGDALKLALDVPTTKLPDGKIQMFYRLRHYGGVGVKSTRTGGTDRRSITLTPNNLAALVQVVTAQLAGKGTVVPLPEDNTLIITCDPSVRASVLALLAGIDVPSRQVEITAKIFEVAHDFDFQIGAKTLLEHIASDNTQSVVGTFNPVDFVESIGTAAGFQGGIVRLLQVFEGCGIKVDATLQLLADTGLIRTVAAPRMTVTAGKTAYMLAGEELPIQSARLSNNNLVTEKTTYKPIGVQLYITPQVIGSDSVKLHVVTTVSAIAGFSELSSMTQKERGQGLINPIVQAREAETFVDVEDGATLVIGGLRMIRTITRERKMPLFGDVPLLEWFFKSHRSQNNVNDLYFFVTPRLVRSNRPKARPKPVALRWPAPASVAPKPALPVKPVGPPATTKPAPAPPAKPAATQPAAAPPAKPAATQPAAAPPAKAPAKPAPPPKPAPAKPATTHPAATPPPKPAPAKPAATQPAPKAKPKPVATASKPPAK